jgi:squalene cyclase
LIQSVTRPFIQKTGCVSCHHNSVSAIAVAAARRNGYRVDEAAVNEERLLIANYLESWRERTLQNKTIAGSQDSVGYVMVGLAASGHPADQATDAQAFWLLRRQSSDGRWPLGTLRPPIESNDIEVTVMAMRTLQLYAPRSVQSESAKAVARARDWLLTASPEATEERALRILGLAWAGANRPAIAAAARALQASQHADGGWSQQASMQSDAYATGEALVALTESGVVARDDDAIRRGVEFLLRTQLEDGSWYVKSRAVPIQAYFESGFPHGADQWISAAASGWAVTALVNAETRSSALRDRR